MAGGGTQNPGNSQQLQQWLQNFPTAPAGGATAAGAPNPQATAQNPFLAKLAGLQGSPQMQLMGQGVNMMRQGQQQPMPQAPLPRQTPVVSGGPPAPQAAGAMMTGGQGQMNPQMMNSLLLRGLLGGGGQM